MTEVSAAIIERSGLLLICRRAKGACAGLWEFPGGKRETGESAAECLARECREELGIELSVGRLYARVKSRGPGGPLSLSFLRATLLSGEPECREHAEIRWVPPEDLPRFSFCPADAGIAARLSREASGGA